ncbi:MAG: FkbM family methyltransferase [bacterium]
MRIWRWWCKHGVKNVAGTIGGSFILRQLHKFYRFWGDEDPPVGSLTINSKLVLHVNPLDLRTYQKIIPELTHHTPEICLATCLTPAGGTYLDVGANTGVLSLCALSGAASSVHSFEPNPIMATILERTRRANRFSSRWYIHPIALGQEVRNGHLYFDPHFSGTASLHSNWQGGGSKTVAISMGTLDNWAHGFKPDRVDVLKIDVEGWEHPVLTGGSTLIKRQQPYICFEYNLSSMQSAGIDPDKILMTLQIYGYTHIVDIGGLPDERRIRPESLRNLKNARLNLLAVPDCRLRDYEIRVLEQLKTF